MGEKPYTVEVQNMGCVCCGAGRTWAIVGPDGAEIMGQGWCDEDEADALAEYLNDSWARALSGSASGGRKHG